MKTLSRAFIIEELTDLVETAVLEEFDRITTWRRVGCNGNYVPAQQIQEASIAMRSIPANFRS
jgi:hypothetical protein